MPPQPSPEPSDAQMEVLRYIIKFVEDHGFQPTQGEIGEAFGVTKNAIQNRLRELARRGLIEISTGEKTRERAIIIKHLRYKAYYEPEASE